ncbi:MAG: hypothetical protein QG671_576 [Actinomycetota bacterium]|nr:hypothetical protein [Actinomycetota bacterium]
MEPYAAATPIPAADAFAASTLTFTALVEDLAGPDMAGLTHAQVEDVLETRGRDLLRHLFQDHLDLRTLREELDLTRRVARGERPAGRSRLERGHHRDLATVVGTVTVRRCALREPGTRNVYPTDVVLSLPEGLHSHGLRRLAVREAVRSSYDTAHDAIERRCGPVLGKRQAEALVAAAAVDIPAFYRRTTPAPAPHETVLVISADAKGIVMRPEHLRPATAKAARRARPALRTRLGPGHKPNRKRMATLAVVYDTDPVPRRAHDVIAVPGGRSEQRLVRPGPSARGTWLTGSVAHDPATVIAAAFDHAAARDPQHVRPWVVLVDGARHQLDLIHDQATRHQAHPHVLLDLVHVLERLWTAAWCFHAPGDPKVEDWVAVHALDLLSGRLDHTLETIQAQADHTDLTNSQHATVAETLGYLRGNADHLHYDQALAHGWPIATGVIEGACRHLIGDRLDICGSRWGVPGAEALLTLRALIDNGDFDAYWDFHLAQEHTRIHQDAYQLSA